MISQVAGRILTKLSLCGQQHVSHLKNTLKQHDRILQKLLRRWLLPQSYPTNPFGAHTEGDVEVEVWAPAGCNLFILLILFMLETIAEGGRFIRDHYHRNSRLVRTVNEVQILPRRMRA